MNKAELQKAINNVKPKPNARYPRVGEKGNNGFRFYWIHCGTEEKKSEKMVMRIIISEKFQKFIKKHNAAWGLFRIEEKGKTVWKLQIRY